MTSSIWGKQIGNESLRKELALCRGLIPLSIDNEEFKLNLESAFKGSRVMGEEHSDVFELAKIDEALGQWKIRNAPEEGEFLFDWLNPRSQYQYGMSSWTDFTGWHEDTFVNFLKCQFGTRIPAKFLDPGVALLTKTLPLIGVLTTYSCAGHLQKSPEIPIRGKYHAQFFRCVLLSMFNCTEEELLLIHKIDTRDSLIFPAQAESEHYEAYWLIQKIARYLLVEENIRAIRTVKFQISSEDELFDTNTIVSRLKLLLNPIGFGLERIRE